MTRKSVARTTKRAGKAATQLLESKPWSPARRGRLDMTQKFVVWMTRDRALVCDRTLPLEPGCRVLWIENGFACDEGLLVTERPDRCRKVTIDREGGEEDIRIIRNLPKADVVRVTGVYQAMHANGLLPLGNGLQGALRLMRPCLHGDGSPMAAGDVILPVDTSDAA